MKEIRAEPMDTEIAYASQKAGHRPFDCSRRAIRQQALAVLASARVPGESTSGERVPAQVIDLNRERARRDTDSMDFLG